MGGGEILECYPSKGRLDMEPDNLLIPHEGALSHRTSHGAIDPLVEILTDRKTFVVEHKAVLPIGKRHRQLCCYLLTGPTIECLPFTSLGRIYRVLSHPTTVLPAADTALAVTALLCHLVLL